MRFAGSIVARQQFVPGLLPRDGGYRACWSPLLHGPNRDRFASLVRAMPCSARALTSDADAPPTASASGILETFIEAVVDNLVRGANEVALGAASPLGKEVDGRRRRARSSVPRSFASLHDQWLSALRAPDGTMIADSADLARLAREVGEWQRPVSHLADAPARLCFRLDKPKDEESEARRIQLGQGPWRVHYLLQAADDPSLLVPAQAIWKANGRNPHVFSRPGFSLKEYFLRALGQACGFCPRIEASLKASAPSGYELDASGAHEFLTEKAAALEQSGFGVLLPA